MDTKQRKTEWLAGAYAANLAAKAHQTVDVNGRTRVGKNASGIVVTCYGCKYKLHYRMFLNHPSGLYIVLHDQGKYSRDRQDGVIITA